MNHTEKPDSLPPDTPPAGHKLRVLIVGSDGQLGAALSKYLASNGYNVQATTRRAARTDARTFLFDLESPSFEFANTPYDCVVVCAGLTSIAACEKDPSLCERVNVTNTIALIDHFAARSSFIIFLSSTAVFDGNKAFYTFDDAANPATVYGRSKLAVETHIREKHKDRAATLRITKVISETTPFVERWLKDGKDGKPISAYTNRLISPVTIASVCDAVQLLAERKQGGVYQLGGDEEVSFFDFAHQYFAGDQKKLGLITATEDKSALSTSGAHSSLATYLPTKEPQYDILLHERRVSMGLMSGHAYLNDPKRLSFTLSRYKFVSKMFGGLDHVLEIGCADAFGTPLILKEVKKLSACDFDEHFINDVKRTHPFKDQITFFRHDFTKGPREEKYDGIFCMDVLEHIQKEKERDFLGNLCGSLRDDGIAIVGIPSLESQVYASEVSRLGHVNCKSGNELKTDLRKYFDKVFVFSMNDEVVHTGYFPMAQYLIALCITPKKK
jgi:dTDP-4-dehydrorhamnose reductase